MQQKFQARAHLFTLGVVSAGSLLLAGLAVFAVWIGITGEPATAMQTVHETPELKYALQLCNTLASVIIFGVPVAVLYKIQYTRQVYQFTAVSGKQVFLVLLLVGLGLVLSASLVPIMQAIPISKSYAAQFLAAEKNYATQIWSMLNLQSVGGLLGSLIIVAAVPALLEELFFRATLQNLLVQYTQKVWLSIFISSVVFSCIHFSYYGFLSRLALGGLLGAICYYSNTVWLSVLAHFLNNAVAVLQLYFQNRATPLTVEHLWESFNDYLPGYYALPALAAIVAVVFLFRKECLRWYTLQSSTHE
ncbi:MAG: CPBP family intramembrane metalloprotease [Bacteroidetes bacterium]|nr:MAG: CPBP family intramembrane metalloprotease [Bacteroidota bacterium]TAE68344.1 MAG: CPBP family intramembrane metalloprotease [Bacteroidota bacterium]TAF98220.1 MAG: CPBP family intramembrane metalloprotease [Bacteroidota bacterium]